MNKILSKNPFPPLEQGCGLDPRFRGGDKVEQDPEETAKLDPHFRGGDISSNSGDEVSSQGSSFPRRRESTSQTLPTGARMQSFPRRRESTSHNRHNVTFPGPQPPGDGKVSGGSVYISTYGCQMNVNDTERMHSLLEMMNYTPTRDPQRASLIIINSCSVREKPVHKVRSEVGRFRKLKTQNPGLKIGVAGCVAQQEKSRLFKEIPLLDFAFGPDAIDDLPGILARLQAGEKPFTQTKLTNALPYHVQTLIRNPGVSAFVNIMKGCDNFCTFCVVPFTRGRERSRPLDQVLQDVTNLARRGVREVTLLGQNVNSYRSACGAGFSDLLKALCEKTPVQRIRFTSPHPKDFDEGLVDVMQAHRSKIMDLIHLPVQSGNTSVLKRMNRGYSRKEYIQKARMILNRMPGSVLSTDIIVGFPGETPEQFEDTLSLLDEVPFEGIYAFKYSPRPFTKAASYPHQVPEQEKSLRLKRLNDKHNQFAFSRARKYKGLVLDVLVESRDSKTGRLCGRSPQNKVVHFQGPGSLKGQVVSVKIETAYPQTLYGNRV